ncbi:patatin-like phospholipase family protein [Enterovibrio norvegicus]|uniref:patatin-like phospholipase family protein n=1 Tax=Enterovibrio norvegicus TaxID=188144 RepID=UPI0024B08DEF|nr:patatin-like phospholipase family protein [Enterovibrio norvegicus]
MSNYKILSFCGGGERGLMSVKMLGRLQQENPGLLQNTDMLTGCSTGSIISGFLSLYKKYNEFETEDHVLDALNNLSILYTDVIPTSFGMGQEGNPDAPILSQEHMEDFLAKLGNLISPSLDAEKLASLSMFDLSDSFDLMFPSFNIQQHKQIQPGAPYEGITNDSWGMALFNNLAYSPTGNVSIAEAIAASGAMQGMCPSVKVHKSVGKPEILGYFVDGAYVNHDPTIAAVCMAIQQGHKLEEISVISFGTGFMKNYLENPEDTVGWGSEQWLNLSGKHEYPGSKVPPLYVNDNHKNPILNMCLNGTSTNEIPQQSSMLLGQRYAYLNPDLGDEYLPEDCHELGQIKKMIAFADEVSLLSANHVVKKYWV